MPYGPRPSTCRRKVYYTIVRPAYVDGILNDLQLENEASTSTSDGGNKGTATQSQDATFDDLYLVWQNIFRPGFLRD